MFKKLVIALVFVGASALATGCVVATDDGCLSDSECPANTFCASDGVCEEGCVDDDNCEIGAFCDIDGLCSF